MPRGATIDLEPGSLDYIKASPISTMLKPDNFAFGAPGATNNWEKRHYTERARLIDEAIRKEAE